MYPELTETQLLLVSDAVKESLRVGAIS
jgi:hypothetical protein